jgi:hypothetical protein
MTVINTVDKLSELEFHCSVDWSFIVFQSDDSFLFNFIYQNDNLIILRCNHVSTQDRWSNCDYERAVWILRDGSIYQERELIGELRHYFENWETWCEAEWSDLEV